MNMRHGYQRDSLQLPPRSSYDWNVRNLWIDFAFVTVTISLLPVLHLLEIWLWTYLLVESFRP